MKRIGAILRRAVALPPQERALLLEAAWALALARARTRLLSFKGITRTASASGASGAVDLDMARRCACAVRRVARHAPFRAVCLQQSLALYAMLSRRDMPSRLHFGLRRGRGGALDAHVWLSLDGTVLIGEIEERFGELAAFHAGVAAVSATAGRG